MAAYPNTLFLLVMVIIIIGAIAFAVRKGVTGHKMMLLGMNITLFGGVLAVGSERGFGGLAYLIALAGVIVSLIGLGIEDKRKN